MFNTKPRLNADLGYYALHLGATALSSKDVLATLRLGMTIDGQRIYFNENQVAKGIEQEIYFVNHSGEVVRWKAS